jgi:hypothetical protein
VAYLEFSVVTTQVPERVQVFLAQWLSLTPHDLVTFARHLLPIGFLALNQLNSILPAALGHIKSADDIDENEDLGGSNDRLLRLLDGPVQLLSLLRTQVVQDLDNYWYWATVDWKTAKMKPKKKEERSALSPERLDRIKQRMEAIILHGVLQQDAQYKDAYTKAIDRLKQKSPSTLK